MSIFKPHLHKMTAYQPPLEGRDGGKYTLLDFNERTIGVGEPVKQALIDYIQADCLQQYPSYGSVCKQLASYCGVQAEQIMITNGSDQGIELAFRAVAEAGKEAIIPTPSFAMYAQVARVEQLNIIEPTYRLDTGYPVKEVLEAINGNTAIVVVSNPNNPCGTLLPRSDIVRIAKAAAHCAVLVDECYFEYSQVSVCDLLERLPNLVITRTFSKTWGLPSIRFGYLLSCADNINALLNVRGPYDVNQLAVVAVEAALANPQYTQEYVEEVMTQAKPELEDFLHRCGVTFWPSAANYLWVFPDRLEAVERALAKANILVRPKTDAQGRRGLRMTIGTLEQIRNLIKVLSPVLDQTGGVG